MEKGAHVSFINRIKISFSKGKSFVGEEGTSERRVWLLSRSISPYVAHNFSKLFSIENWGGRLEEGWDGMWDSAWQECGIHSTGRPLGLSRNS